MTQEQRPGQGQESCANHPRWTTCRSADGGHGLFTSAQERVS